MSGRLGVALALPPLLPPPLLLMLCGHSCAALVRHACASTCRASKGNGPDVLLIGSGQWHFQVRTARRCMQRRCIPCLHTPCADARCMPPLSPPSNLLQHGDDSLSTYTASLVRLRKAVDDLMRSAAQASQPADLQRISPCSPPRLPTLQ